MGHDSDSDVEWVRWNGIAIEIPASWEAVVSGRTHILFERDFQPVLEIRWEQTGELTSSEWQKTLGKWHKQLPSTSSIEKIQPELSGLCTNVKWSAFYKDSTTSHSGGIFVLEQSRLVILFQLFEKLTKHSAVTQALNSILAPPATENVYRIQDFSLTLPASYTLERFSFKAGLTTLVFIGDNHNLEICRLAQAASRLSSTTLDTILTTLCGSQSLDINMVPEKKCCRAQRQPNLVQQLLIRLKRQHPFLMGALWQQADHDRLFGFVATGNSPIPEELFHNVYENLQPVRKK